MIDKKTRNKMEKLIYDTFDALDPSDTNTDRYKEMFKGMTDLEFDKFFKYLFENENEYLILDIVDYEHSLTIENIEAAAKVIDVPLFEYVIQPHKSPDPNNPISTKYPVPVGYVHEKRVQQMVRKKNSTSTDLGERNALTGQVTGHDKNSRESDVENYALVTLGATENLRELLGPRSDDLVMKDEMYSAITNKGYVSINDLTDDVVNKTALNTVDVYFLSMGIKTDLITNDLIIKKTLKKD